MFKGFAELAVRRGGPAVSAPFPLLQPQPRARGGRGHPGPCALPGTLAGLLHIGRCCASPPPRGLGLLRLPRASARPGEHLCGNRSATGPGGRPLPIARPRGTEGFGRGEGGIPGFGSRPCPVPLSLPPQL